MIKTEFKSNFDDFARAIEHVPTDVEKQFAFAINRIAFVAMQEARADFPKNFIQRNKFMERSIVVEKATRSSKAAMVGTVNEKMALHLLGGQEKASVALKAFRGSSGTGKVPRSKTVDKLIKEGASGSSRYFVQTISGRKFVFQKTGTKRQRQRARAGKTGGVYPRLPIMPLWKLQEGKPIRIKADWNLPDVVAKTLDEKAPAIIEDLIQDAWEHARKKGRTVI